MSTSTQSIRRLFTLGVIGTLLAIGNAACGDRANPPLAVSLLQGGADSTGLSLLPTSIDVRVGGSAQLVATGASTLLPAAFITSAPGIASVSATGLVTGVAPGSATITASSTRDPTRQASALVRVLGP